MWELRDRVFDGAVVQEWQLQMNILGLLTRLAALGVGMGVVGMAPGLARASEPVVVTPPRVGGELDRAIEDRLEQRLDEVLRRSEVELVTVPDTVGRRALGCEDDDCRATLLADAGARYLVIPEFTLDDRDYHLRLTLYAADGAATAWIAETCAICGLAEATDLLGDLGARIGRKIEVARRSSVVEIDEPAKPRSKRRKIARGVAVGALVLGGGGLAAGATLMAIDEQPNTSNCSGANIDAAGNCRWRLDTRDAGVAFVAGGAVLVGTAIVLLIVARKRPSSIGARIQPAWGGLALQF